MDPNRKLWNASHQKLNRAFAAGDREKAIELFLHQHAMVHSAKMAKTGLWSFEDEVLDDLTDNQCRMIPPGGEHSIVWISLHLTRIEDITMNMLVAGEEQLFQQGDWAKKLHISIHHSANKMDDASMTSLSANIDIRALKAYRIEVGRRTRKIVKKLQAQDFTRKVDPSRLEKVLGEGAVIPEAMEIIQYWSKKTIAGLLLMPPTRHCILHWNEAMAIKRSLQ